MTLPTSNISIQDMQNEASGGGSTTRISQVFTSTTTFTVPAGITSINIAAIGGGGGGGGASYDGDSHAGGGGGPGGVHIVTGVTVIPGEVLQVEVGAAGTAASTFSIGTCVGNGTINGGNGGQSRVYRASSPGISLALATGGFGGNGATGDNPAPTDANHSNKGSGNSGTPTVVTGAPDPWTARNSYFFTDGASNNTGFGAGGNGNGLAVGVMCPTPGTSGAVMISYTQTLGGGGGGNSLDDYYAGGGIVPNPPPTSIYQTAPIPTSGTIEMGSFLGVTFAGIEEEVDQALANSLSSTGYNVGTRATALGWNGTSPLRMKITIMDGVVLTNTTAGYAFTLGSLPAGSFIELINNGNIVGRAGQGGDGGSVGGTYGSPTFSNGQNGLSGGIAASFSYPITITNNGLIGGGGGGGGGGSASYAFYTDGITLENYGYGAGGGGGGAGGFGSEGSGGVSTFSGGDVNYNLNGRNGTSGTGYAPGFRGYNGNNNVDGNGTAGWGGIGGGFGQAGYDGSASWNQWLNPLPLFATINQAGVPGSGGNGGDAFVGGTYVTWLNYGTIAGDIDSWGTWGGGGTNNSGLMTAVTLAKETYMSGSWSMSLDDRWYWNVPNAGWINVPAGTDTFYFIYANTTGSNITARLYGSIDNQMNSITINGVAGSVGTFPAGNAYTAQYTTGNFILVPGSNVIAVTLQNTANSPAGFNLRLQTSGGAPLAGPLGWFQ